MSIIPTIGCIVLYTLNAQDVAQIKERRAPLPYQGSDVSVGDVYPMIIARVWGNTSDAYVNGQVILDGLDTHWATSRQVGEGPGTFAWPTRS